MTKSGSTKAEESELLASYKDAIWSYLLEHCDLTPNGALFVKFHTSDRATFERHVRARWKRNYHRGDPIEKNRIHVELRLEHERKKWKAKERNFHNRIRGLKMLAGKQSDAKPAPSRNSHRE